MSTAILYHSYHHGNTKLILDAIKEKYPLRMYDVSDKSEMDLSKYDIIGFASGIYRGSMSRKLIKFAKENLPENKDVFFIATAGAPKDSNLNSMRKVAKNKNCREIGSYLTKGFDTFGPLAFFGGVNKGRPDKEDLENRLKFYSVIIGQISKNPSKIQPE
jgi:flavodoxin